MTQLKQFFKGIEEKLLPTPEEFLNNMDLDLYNI